MPFTLHFFDPVRRRSRRRSSSRRAATWTSRSKGWRARTEPWRTPSSCSTTPPRPFARPSGRSRSPVRASSLTGFKLYTQAHCLWFHLFVNMHQHDSFIPVWQNTNIKDNKDKHLKCKASKTVAITKSKPGGFVFSVHDVFPTALSQVQSTSRK